MHSHTLAMTLVCIKVYMYVCMYVRTYVCMYDIVIVLPVGRECKCSICYRWKGVNGGSLQQKKTVVMVDLFIHRLISVKKIYKDIV